MLEGETGLETDEKEGEDVFEDGVKSHARPLLNVSSEYGASTYKAIGSIE